MTNSNSAGKNLEVEVGKIRGEKSYGKVNRLKNKQTINSHNIFEPETKKHECLKIKISKFWRTPPKNVDHLFFSSVCKQERIQLYTQKNVLFSIYIEKNNDPSTGPVKRNRCPAVLPDKPFRNFSTKKFVNRRFRRMSKMSID